MIPIPSIIATQRLSKLQDSLTAWQSSTGPMRARYRGYVRHDIAAWKRARDRAAAVQTEALREWVAERRINQTVAMAAE